MNANKEDAFLFASETNIFRIVSIAKIISWIILAFYLISFADNLRSFVQEQARLPSQLWQWIITLISLFFAPAIGLFYFLTLQGLAQGLNLGLDLYSELKPEDTDEK